MRGQREGGRGVKQGVGGEGGRRRERRRISFTESYIAQNFWKTISSGQKEYYT